MTPSPELPKIVSTLTPEEKELFNIDLIDDWREKQRVELYELRNKAITDGKSLEDTEYITTFGDSIDDSLAMFLEEKGITSDTPNYEEIKRLYRESSIDKIRDDEWFVSAKNRGSGTDESGRDKVITLLRTRNRVDSPVDTTDLPTDPTEREALRGKLDELARKKQEAYVSMINAPLFRRGKRKEAQVAYDAAEAEYIKALKEQYRHDLESMPVDLDEAGEKAHIETMVNQRSNAENLAQHQLLIQKGGKKAEWLEKYAGMSTAKKIGIGVGLGAAGAAAGFVAGVVGAAPAAVLAGLKMYGVSRSYFLGKAQIYKKPADDAVAFTYDASKSDAAEAQAAEFTRTYYRERIESAEKTKKRALKIGLGAAALTGAAGAAGAWAHSSLSAARHVGANDGHWQAGYIQHINMPGGGEAATSTNGAAPSLWDVTHGDKGSGNALTQNQGMFAAGKQNGVSLINPHPHEGVLPSSGLRGYEGAGISGGGSVTPEVTPLTTDVGGQLPGAGSVAETASQHAPTGKDYLAYAAEHQGANYVSRGEGMYHTFSELGIKSDDHEKLLKLVGPKLEKSGFLYRDEHLGGWGISEPGKTPDRVLKTILKTAQEHHMVDITDHVHEAGEVGTGNFATVVDVDKGEGILQSLKDAGLENPTLDDVHNIQDELIKLGDAYKAPELGGAGLYYSDGTMSKEGAQVIWDYVHGHDHAPVVAHDDISYSATEQHYVGNGQAAPVVTEVDPNAISHDANAQVYVGEGKTAPLYSAPNAEQVYVGQGRTSVLLNDADTLHQSGSGNALVDPSTLKGIDDMRIDSRNLINFDQANAKMHDLSNLVDAHKIETINTNPDFQQALKYIHEDVGSLKYPGTDTNILYLNRAGNWQMNEIPTRSYVPARFTNTLIAYEQRLYDLAA